MRNDGWCRLVQKVLREQIQYEITLDEALDILYSLRNEVIKELFEGREVSLADFGALKPVVRKARFARVPSTPTELISVPERASVRFKPYPHLRSVLDAKLAEQVELS